MEEHMTETAQKKPVQMELRYVSPDKLDFDIDNPRFAGQLTNHTQEQIQKEIFNEPHYASELLDSLLENGFIDYEPLVVRQHGERYIVIEGNRRLSAIKEIRSNPSRYHGKKSDLESIPVLVFPEKPNEQQANEMRVYLGVHHLLGFREWPPISKAQYLDKESKKAGGLDSVIKETRITRTNARRFLVPFRLLKRADFELPKREEFWVIGEGLQRAGIKNFLQLEVDPKTMEILSYNKNNLNLLLNDLYGIKKGSMRDQSTKVVFDTRDLSRLAKVLGSSKAASKLHSGHSLEEAEIYVDTREQSMARLSKLVKDLGILLNKILPDSKKSDTAQQLQKTYKQFEVAVKNFIR